MKQTNQQYLILVPELRVEGVFGSLIGRKTIGLQSFVHHKTGWAELRAVRRSGAIKRRRKRTTSATQARQKTSAGFKTSITGELRRESMTVSWVRWWMKLGYQWIQSIKNGVDAKESWNQRRKDDTKGRKCCREVKRESEDVHTGARGMAGK